MNEETMRPDHWLGLMCCVSFSESFLYEHLLHCEISIRRNMIATCLCSLVVKALGRHGLRSWGSNLSPGASTHQGIISNNLYTYDEQGDNPRQEKEVLTVLISSIKVLVTLAWLKQIDLAGHWLVQHTASVRAKPDSRPHTEGVCYK